MVHEVATRGRSPHLCYFTEGVAYKILGSPLPVLLRVWSPDEHRSELSVPGPQRENELVPGREVTIAMKCFTFT